MDNPVSITSIQQLAEEVIEDKSIFITEVLLCPNNLIQIYVDGDNGAPINQITKISRAIYKEIDERNWFPGRDFLLEVSSPGVDEPIKYVRQLHKHIGRKLAITSEDDQVIEGKFLALEDNIITIEELINQKKKETKLHTFEFEATKEITVLISFK